MKESIHAAYYRTFTKYTNRLYSRPQGPFSLAHSWKNHSRPQSLFPHSLLLVGPTAKFSAYRKTRNSL